MNNDTTRTAAAISLDGCVARPGWTLRAHGLEIDASVTAVVGANGAGKTTLGRVVAGLDRLATGRLLIGGGVVDDPDGGVHVPPHRRNVGVVFQEHRLFAHLRVIDNVAFGLRRSGIDRAEARRRAGDLLEVVGTDRDVWQKHPAALSGGQRQRVAIARALARQPDVLVVDEPLASVDAAARAALRTLIAESPARATLLITHDRVDVATLAEAVVVLDRGEVAARGSVAEVTASPGCEWAATFLGANVVSGRAEGSSVKAAGELVLTLAEAAHGPVFVTFPANAVTLHTDRPSGSARNAWRAELQRVDLDGERARVHLGGPVEVRADVTRRSAEDLGLRPGVTVWASVKATELTVVR